MKVKKRLIVVADIICEEDFDTTDLLLCEDLSRNSICLDDPVVLVPEGTAETGHQWEIEDYVICEEVTLSDEVEQ